MSETEMLQAILKKLDQIGMPLSAQAWDVADIARYMKRTPQIVRETITCQPDFPDVLRLPSEGKARPLYNAQEVVDWLETRREKRGKRPKIAPHLS